MLEGDSITQGFNGDYTWRYRLAQEFTRQHRAVDFVGPNRYPYVAPGYRASYYLASGFDSDHFGVGASTLYRHSTWIEAEARRQQPDVIVLEAGVNDLRWGGTPTAVGQVLEHWVAAARRGQPHVRIVLTTVLGAVDPTRTWLPGRIAAYDAMLPGLASRLSTSDSPITLVDTRVGFDPAAYTWDGLHPTPTGEGIIAYRVGQELHRLGVLTQPPLLPGFLPWLRNLRPQLKGVGTTSASIAWSREAISYARIRVQRVGHDATVTGPRYDGQATLTHLVRGATYDVQLSAVRGRMVARWGDPVRFRTH